MESTEYSVTGMTCSHCERSVAQAVNTIAGVSQVAVDVREGRLAVTGDQTVAPEAVIAAIEEAGYSAEHHPVDQA
ncbi:heavy-metal-associated domain-containing protein [Phytoactinopolyspora limicola]|uniref:heavy-metal-associated domain-containing protein n=1 Tax=Phytoactinopolyspora limicola TaxID=2715536 RepID=UPI00140D4E90|nr:heavy metal-associated domain-containing protein [Phytoactinopolyspora limicola]